MTALCYVHLTIKSWSKIWQLFVMYTTTYNPEVYKWWQQFMPQRETWIAITPYSSLLFIHMYSKWFMTLIVTYIMTSVVLWWIVCLNESFFSSKYSSSYSNVHSPASRVQWTMHIQCSVWTPTKLIRVHVHVGCCVGMKHTSECQCVHHKSFLQS